MSELDVSCYGCGVILRIDANEPWAEAGGPCRYCGTELRYFTRPADRRAIRDLASTQFLWGRDTPLIESDAQPIDDGAFGEEDGVAGDLAEHETGGGGALPETSSDETDASPELDGWRSTIVLNGVPLHLALRFKHASLLGEAVASTPMPAGPHPGDQRLSRWEYAVGHRYAEFLKSDLESLAPRVEVIARPRYPSETGGPGVEFDVVQFVVGGAMLLAAYPAAKELIGDLRRLMKRLTERTGASVEIVDGGIAALLAMEALEDQLIAGGADVTDLTLIATSPLERHVDFTETYGFLISVSANDEMYVVAVQLDGTIASISATALPAIEPPATAGLI